MADLPELIAAFVAAKAAYDAADEYDDDLESEVCDAAEYAVIVYPCQTIDDIRLKARLFLTSSPLNDTLRNGHTGEDSALDVFLRSLLGEGF